MEEAGKIMRPLIIALLLSFFLPYIALGEAQLDQDLERRQMWAKEFGRWSAYCVQQQKAELLFEGCRDRVEGIRSLTALYRLVRQSGYAREASRLVDSQSLRLWMSAPKRLEELSAPERVALLDLSREALLATGDLIWRDLLTQTMLKSVWFKAILCELQDRCALELISMMASSQLLVRDQFKPKLSQDQIVLDAYLLARLPVLINAARQLSLPHPQGQINSERSSDQTRSLWSVRAQLASLAYSPSELTQWWSGERGTQSATSELQVIPISTITEPRQLITLERILGIGALFRGLSKISSEESQALRKIFHLEARSCVEQYLKFRNLSRSYMEKVSALGVIAMSADLDEQGFPLTFPAQRWLSDEMRISPSTLSSNVRATGMFSELAIRDLEERRGLYFVRPNGAQLLETEIDLRRPDVLQVRYTQDMLAVFPFAKRPPQRGLLIGLGGGAMVHALRTYVPELALDVVEIDPVVVRFAREHFGVQALEDQKDPRLGALRVIIADGFEFLSPQRERETERYDTIWMDAFLQPHEGTDSTGSPLNLKTLSFLKRISDERLTDQGMIAINLNHHAGLQRDMDTIRAAFPSSTIWQVPETGNYIAIGFKSRITDSKDQIEARAQELNFKQGTPFRYEALLKRTFSSLSPSL